MHEDSNIKTINYISQLYPPPPLHIPASRLPVLSVCKLGLLNVRKSVGIVCCRMARKQNDLLPHNHNLELSLMDVKPMILFPNWSSRIKRSIAQYKPSRQELFCCSTLKVVFLDRPTRQDLAPSGSVICGFCALKSVTNLMLYTLCFVRATMTPAIHHFRAWSRSLRLIRDDTACCEMSRASSRLDSERLRRFSAQCDLQRNDPHVSCFKIRPYEWSPRHQRCSGATRDVWVIRARKVQVEAS